MNAIESYKVCVGKKYADFKGVASRSEYWWFWAITVLTVLGLPVLAFIIGEANVVTQVALMLAWVLGCAGYLCPFVAVSLRRLRDAGYSGWCFLIRFIPVVGTIITWYLMMQKSKGNSTSAVF